MTDEQKAIIDEMIRTWAGRHYAPAFYEDCERLLATTQAEVERELLGDIAYLRNALKAIDDIAVSKKAGSARAMQEVARIALAHSNGDSRE